MKYTLALLSGATAALAHGHPPPPPPGPPGSHHPGWPQSSASSSSSEVSSAASPTGYSSSAASSSGYSSSTGPSGYSSSASSPSGYSSGSTTSYPNATTSIPCGPHATPTGNLSYNVAFNVNGAETYQTMVGGGCSGAFGAACAPESLPASMQSEIISLLFDENQGALSILRNLIGSSQGATILPEVPATPCDPLNFTSITAINNDSCQLTFAQEALKYNPNLFLYADAWSAPGGFKTTGQQAGGGYLCGVRRSNCTYDWRESYAQYLIEYVRQYAAQGIKTSLLGAYNERDFNPVTYSGMLSDGYQGYDFLSVLYPAVKAAYPDLKVSCCDSTGARQQRDFLYELNRLGGGQYFDINTYHNYQSDIKKPFSDLLPYGQPTVETEWSDGGSTFVGTWDVLGQNFEGFQWAIYMHWAFVNNVAGWSAWWCTWTGGDAALINVNGTTQTYEVAARLWAFSGYFRFARPGAVRLDATTTVPEVRLTAWKNTNGTISIPVVNSAHYTYTASFDLASVGDVNHATAYLTDNEHNVTNVGSFDFSGGQFTADIEPRSMKVFFLETK